MGLSENHILERIENFLKETNLSIGSIEEMKKGQVDFSSWGSGFLMGSKNWVVNKLATKLTKLDVSSLQIEKTKDYSWQTSKLEGFSIRIQALQPSDMLAGYYIGQVKQDLYGLFGYGFNQNEEEHPDRRTMSFLSKIFGGKKSQSNSGGGTPKAIKRCPQCGGQLNYAGVTKDDMAAFYCPACDAETGITDIGLHKSDGDWQ